MSFATPDDLVSIFDGLFEWEERYRFIIELGNELPLIAEEDKTPENKLNGCQSNVWLKRVGSVPRGANTIEERNSIEPGFDFVADSDSQIVKGLIAMVRLIYLHKTPREILDFDIEGLFDRIQLTQHLTPNRSNGLRFLVNQIKTWAKQS